MRQFSKLIVFIVSLTLCACADRVHADAPRVVTDIAPVHSLVSLVMGDVASPVLLVKASASPHDFALRPSAAASINRADIIIRVGGELTPWLDSVASKLAGDTPMVNLINADGVTRWPARSEPLFADHAHDHKHEEKSVVDPHAWLDPENALVWLDVIVAELQKLNPENAALYTLNVSKAKQSIKTSVDQLTRSLAFVSEKPLLVFHDSFQYFERYFSLNVVGAVAATDAKKPGPARLENVRKLIKELGVNCALVQQQFNEKLIHSIAPAGSIQLVVADAIGAKLEPGKDLYGLLLTQLGESLEQCN